MVTEKDALEILLHAERNDVAVRLDGGWGVDALLGCQTRDHDDIDLFVERKDGLRYIQLLRKEGFSEQSQTYATDSHTVWRDDRGRTIDLHLFETDATGELLFEGAVYPAEIFSGTGHIAGKEVRCIPPAEQVAFHLGYAHDENDVHDVRLLCERFGLDLPDACK